MCYGWFLFCKKVRMRKVFGVLVLVFLFAQIWFALTPSEEKAKEIQVAVDVILQNSKNKNADLEKINTIFSGYLNSCKDEIICDAIKIVMTNIPNTESKQSKSTDRWNKKIVVPDGIFGKEKSTITPLSYITIPVFVDKDREFIVFPWSTKKALIVLVNRDKKGGTPYLSIWENMSGNYKNSITPYWVYTSEYESYFHEFNTEKKLKAYFEWDAPWGDVERMAYVFLIPSNLQAKDYTITNDSTLSWGVALWTLTELVKSNIKDGYESNKLLLDECALALRWKMKKVPAKSCWNMKDWEFDDGDPAELFYYYNEKNKNPYTLQISKPSLGDYYCRKIGKQKNCLWVSDWEINNSIDFRN